jgi:phage baseplate assembly protein W
MASGITPKLPLNIGEEGDFGLVKTYEELVKQNLKNLLLTIPGEKPMDSDFGAGIQRFLFEPNIEITYGEMQTEVSTKIEKYMPFLELEDIVVRADPKSENAIKVEIFYIITPLEVEDTLLLTIRNIAFS